jgi:galactokinase
VIVCNTMVKHTLAADGYNERRADCEAGVRALSTRLPGIRALRDVSFGDLEAHRDLLPDRVYHRCRHVVTENVRVLEAAAMLRHGSRIEGLGWLMRQSHHSLRHDYEVSIPELDLMAAIAMRTDGAIGARMTGGGFGGCTVNLVRADRAASFTAAVSAGYEAETGHIPDIYTCTPSDGVGREPGATGGHV